MLYQAHYIYSPADDNLYYSDFEGDLCYHKEDCLKEIKGVLHPDISKEAFMEGYPEDYPFDEEYYEGWKESVLANIPTKAFIREMGVH